MRRLLRTFASNEVGNIAIMSALFMVVIMGFAALGVDAGKLFTDRRKAQGTVDLAAIAAVNDLANAGKAASATVQRNNYPADTAIKVELGVYAADATLKPDERFKPSAVNAANAARVTMQTASFLMFGKLLTGKPSFDVTTRAIATRTAFGSFAIGSRLLKIDGGLLNQILGGLLGTNVSLSVMDYQALIDARLDLFDFMNTLATRLKITGASYDTLLKTNVKAADVVQAMVDTEKAVYGSTNLAVKALSGIAQGLNGSTDKLTLGALVDVGPYNSMQIGQKPKLGVAVAALDILMATGQLASGRKQIDVGLNVNIPGIAGVSLKLAVGEPPKGTSWITVGGEGASVHTAQTRLLLNVQLVGGGAAPVVSLPLYLELASATAKLSKLSCAFPDGNASRATLAVTPAIIDAWVGAVSTSEFGNFKSAPNPPPASLVNTALLKITGRAHAAATNMTPTPVSFDMADIAKQTKKTIGTKQFAASLLSKLMSDMDLDVKVVGLGIGLPGAVNALLAGILANAVAPLDQLVSNVLQTLGVGLGQADVWVMGLRCDGAVLVN